MRRNSIYFFLFGFLFFSIAQKLPFPEDSLWVMLEFKPMVITILACFCLIQWIPKERTLEIALVILIMLFEALQLLFCILFTIKLLTIEQTNFVYPFYFLILLFSMHKIFKKAQIND